jgi:hypothetical protein
MSGNVEIWRAAIRVIRECGQESDPKALAFARSSELHARGELQEAFWWAKVAHAIEAILENVPDWEAMPDDIH